MPEIFLNRVFSLLFRVAPLQYGKSYTQGAGSDRTAPNLSQLGGQEFSLLFRVAPLQYGKSYTQGTGSDRTAPNLSQLGGQEFSLENFNAFIVDS